MTCSIVSTCDKIIYSIAVTATLKLLVEKRSAHSSTIFSAVFSFDGKQIVSVSGDNTIRVWDVGNMTLQTSSDNYLTIAAISRDGRRVVAVSESTNEIWLCDVSVLSDVTVAFSPHGFQSIAISPDSMRIASASSWIGFNYYQMTICLWDSSTLTLLAIKENAHDLPINSVAFSPDGTLLVSSSSDNAISVWDAFTLIHLRRKTLAHDEWIRSAAFSPD
eukprot:3021559-Prymnesium_polylepis.1